MCANATAIAPSSTAAKLQDLSRTTKFWSTIGVAVVVLTNHMAGGAGEIAQPGRIRRCRASKHTPAEEAGARKSIAGCRKGHIDRSLLAPNLNDYFDAQTVADFRDSLAPLGEPLTFTQTLGESCAAA